MPSAPGMFCTSTDGFPGRYFVRNGAIRRPVASVPPPAVEPTSIVMVRPRNVIADCCIAPWGVKPLGGSCATADTPKAASPTAPTQNDPNFIASPPHHRRRCGMLKPKPSLISAKVHRVEWRAAGRSQPGHIDLVDAPGDTRDRHHLPLSLLLCAQFPDR